MLVIDVDSDCFYCFYLSNATFQPVFTCSKSTVETQQVEFVQSEQ